MPMGCSPANLNQNRNRVRRLNDEQPEKEEFPKQEPQSPDMAKGNIKVATENGVKTISKLTEDLAVTKNGAVQHDLSQKEIHEIVIENGAALAPDNIRKNTDSSSASSKQSIALKTTKKVPLNIRHGSHRVSDPTANLLREIGGGNRIREMTTRFYEKAFVDQVLDRFITSHDEPHGERLGNWIVEKMGGEGNVWSNSRPPNARQMSHFKAWNNSKREAWKRGWHFKLDDCRVWMRLMFWSAREIGLAEEHPAFFSWYVDFIGYFIGIYESRAPPYARREAKWSEDPGNIQRYIDDGRIMKDVVKPLSEYQ